MFKIIIKILFLCRNTMISYHDTIFIQNFITSRFSLANAWHWNLKLPLFILFHFSTKTFNNVISWIIADRSMHRYEQKRMCARTHKRICRIIKSRVLCNHGKQEELASTQNMYSMMILAVHTVSWYSLSKCP